MVPPMALVAVAPEAVAALMAARLAAMRRRPTEQPEATAAADRAVVQLATQPAETPRQPREAVVAVAMAAARMPAATAPWKASGSTTLAARTTAPLSALPVAVAVAVAEL